MLSRRSFGRLLAALPFVGATAAAAPVRREPRISLTRPEQKGVAGVTYFAAGASYFNDRTGPAHYLDSHALRVHGFAGGGDLRTVTFEVDLAGGWVGIFAHYFTHDGNPRLHYGDGGSVPLWVIGDVMSGGACESLKPYPGAKVLEKPKPGEFTDTRYRLPVVRSSDIVDKLEQQTRRIEVALSNLVTD
jgi:hypothetical protein